MKEVLNNNMNEILSSKILEKESLNKNEYIIMSIHREENVDSPKNFTDLLESINELYKKYNFSIIISTHPRTKKIRRNRIHKQQYQN